jgi:hypothetical protein
VPQSPTCGTLARNDADSDVPGETGSVSDPPPTDEDKNSADELSEHVRVHEAGHTIVGHATGLDVQDVIGKNAGHVSAFVPHDMTEYQRVISLAKYYAAGNAAERIILGEPRSDHGKKDREEIEKLRLQHPEWTRQIDLAVEDADELINENREAIEKLAGRLRRTPPTVRGDDLASHLDPVPVELPPPDPPP